MFQKRNLVFRTSSEKLFRFIEESGFSLQEKYASPSKIAHKKSDSFLTCVNSRGINPPKIHSLIFIFWRKLMFRKPGLFVSAFYYYYAFSNAGPLRGWAGV